MVLRVSQANSNHQDKGINSNFKPSIKCAISISNKVSKKSVTRSKLRRLFHHHLSLKFSKIKLSYDVWAFISLKPSCMEIPNSSLLEECDKLFLKAGITK